MATILLWINSIAMIVLCVLFGITRTYLSAYSKRKAENLATHEDLSKLVEQMTVITQTTKEIEAKVSNDVWDRQKQWEIRRDVYFEVMRTLAVTELALAHLNSTYIAAKTSSIEEEKVKQRFELTEDDVYQSWLTYKSKAIHVWEEAKLDFQRAAALAHLVADRKVQGSLDEVSRVIAQKADHILSNKTEATLDLRQQLSELRSFIRIELGIQVRD